MKKKIMVDMDDVITTGGFLYLVNEYLGTNYTEDDFDNYYFQDKVPDINDFNKFILTKNVYDYCSIIDGCYDALKKLNEVYDIYVCTSYIWRDMPNDSGHLLEQKFNFLKDNFDFIRSYRFIFASDKSIFNFDIKIDDRLDNLSNCKTKLLFTAYHNKNISKEELNKLGIVRVDSWKEVEEKLL